MKATRTKTAASRASARCGNKEAPVFARGLNEQDYCEPCWRAVTGIPALSMDDRTIGYPHPAPRGKVPLPKRRVGVLDIRPDYQP